MVVNIIPFYLPLIQTLVLEVDVDIGAAQF